MPAWRPLAERYEEKILRCGPDECHPWIAYCNASGHGTISVGREMKLAHRVGWELTFSPIPPGMCVLHSCDNPPCQNPVHWHLGTQLDNISERTERHRAAFGNTNSAKISYEIAEQIRAEYVKGENGGIRTLSDKYSLGRSQIHNIVTNKTWRKSP